MYLSVQHKLFHLLVRSGYKVDFGNLHFVSHFLCGYQLLLPVVHIDVVQPSSQQTCNSNLIPNLMWQCNFYNSYSQANTIPNIVELEMCHCCDVINMLNACFWLVAGSGDGAVLQFLLTWAEGAGIWRLFQSQVTGQDHVRVGPQTRGWMCNFLQDRKVRNRDLWL